MNQKSMTKILSTTLSAAMVFSSIPMPAHAFGPAEITAPAFVSQLTPPEKFGYVASSFAPNGETRPRLILISDLHSHVEVQHNIRGILEHVVSQLRSTGSSMENKAVPIFVEGGWENHLEEPLNKVTNPAVRKFLDEYLLQKSRMNAAQAYSEKVAGTGQVELIGVESKTEYLFNRAQFLKTYPERKALLTAIQRQEIVIRDLSQYLMSGSFGRLQQMRDDYNAGRIRPETFAHALVQMARHSGIHSSYLTVLQNVSSASQYDLDIAFAQVYRAVLAAAAEKRPLSAFLRQSLNNESTIRENLAQIDANLDLLKRLVANQLTPSEVPLCMARIGELIRTAELLLNDSPLKETAARTIRESFGFYPLAQLRDKTLAQNSLKALDSFGPNATGILVAGGFHTDAITQQLREKGISYLVINPTITRDLTTEEQLNYVRWMADEKLTPGEIAQDVESLRRQKPVHTAVAVAAISDTPGPTEGPESKGYLRSVDVEKITGLNDEQMVNMAAHLERTNQLAIVLPTVNDANPEAFSAAQNQIMAIAKREAGSLSGSQEKVKALADELTNPNNGFISVGQTQPGTYDTVAGLDPQDAADFAQLVNTVAGASEGGRQVANWVDQIHLIAIKNAAKVVGTNARVYVDPTSTVRSGVIDQDILQNWFDGRKARHALKEAQAEGNPEKIDSAEKAAAAFDNAEQLLMHELKHVFDKSGKYETPTVLGGWAVQLAAAATRIAAEGGGEAAIRAGIETEFARIIGSVDESVKLADNPLYHDILSASGLATRLANAIDPHAFTQENAKRILAALEAEQPERVKSEYQKEKEEQDLIEGAFSMGNLKGGDSEAAKIRAAVAQFGLDAKNLSDAEIRRIVKEVSGQESTDVAADRAIVDAA